MPDDPAAPVLAVGAFALGPAGQQPVDRLADRTVLLVARYCLDRPPLVGLHEGHVVVHDVEQPDRIEDSGDEDVLLADSGLVLV